jgi:sarcosine oxidase subunit gamma
MAEPQRQNPLAYEPAHGNAPEAGVSLLELPLRSMVTLRGDSAGLAESVKQITGCNLPAEPCHAVMNDDHAVLWMGPDEWLVVGRPETRAELPVSLRTALGDAHAGVTEVGESMAIFGLGGPRARDLLAKGCTIDLHPRAFRAGQCVSTLLAKAQVTLHQLDDAPTFNIFVHRSFAVYLWRWILDAGLEYGVAVETP